MTTILATETVQFCQTCGRNVNDYPHERLKRVYRCPQCGSVVCADCCYKHHSCETRLCANCLAKLNWRKSSREWEGAKGHSFRPAVYEHTFSADHCRTCDKKDSWFRVADAIRFKIKHGLDRLETFHGVEE